MITNNRFKEKIILVFGGAKGIGRSIVSSFAQEGGIVHFTDIDDKEENMEREFYPDAEKIKKPFFHCYELLFSFSQGD